MGLAVHPNFGEEDNRWIYLFYTHNNGSGPNCPVNGPVNRCSRFVLDDDDWIINQNSEEILFTQYVGDDTIHNGGSMAFGIDGMLYVVTGDSGASQITQQPWSQSLWNLHGSVIRITDSGGIPSDNPFAGGSGTARCNANGRTTDETQVCQEIYAYGLRNPKKIIMDPYSTTKVRYFISDVGYQAWEEINVGGQDYSGANYGWPIREGPCGYNQVDVSCSLIGSSSQPPDPYYWYQHNTQQDGSITGVAIPPPESGWPGPYGDSDSLYFADMKFNKIIHATKNSNAACNSCIPPVPGFQNETIHSFPIPAFLTFGPYLDLSAEDDSSTSSTTALYYANRQQCCEQNIRRIVYKGGDNLAPIAIFTVDHSSIAINGNITFNASTTTDPNDSIDSLNFAWNFGDGGPLVGKRGMVVSYSFGDANVYYVELTVTDPSGATGRYSDWISVGNPPVVEILSPIQETMFAVGDVFVLIGAGVDSNGLPLDPETQLSWEVREYRGSTYDSFLPENTIGNEINLPPSPSHQDLDSATNSYLEVLLTGTDSNGISATVSQIIMPKAVILDFDTEPTGLTLVIDGKSLVMPQRIVSWENHNLTIFAPEQQGFIFTAEGSEYATPGEEYQLAIPVPTTPDGEIRSYTLDFEPTTNQTMVTSESPTTPSSLSPSSAPFINSTQLSTSSPSMAPSPAGPGAGPSNQPTSTASHLSNSTDSFSQEPTESPTVASTVGTTDTSSMKQSSGPSEGPNVAPTLPPVAQKTLNPTQTENNPLLINNGRTGTDDDSGCDSLAFGSQLRLMCCFWVVLVLIY